MYVINLLIHLRKNKKLQKVHVFLLLDFCRFLVNNMCHGELGDNRAYMFYLVY